MTKPSITDILKAAKRDHLPIVDAGHISRHLGIILTDGPPHGIDPPYELLRKTIYKIIPTHLWLVGAYTSHGKSLFAIDLVMRLLLSTNPSVAVFSTEMSCAQYTYRMLAWQTGIPSLRLMYGTLNERELRSYNEACQALKETTVYVFDDLYHLKDIAKACEALKKYSLNIVVIDFLQGLAGKGSIYERMSEMAIEIQSMAKRLDVTVIALSQIANWAARDKEAEVIGYKGAGELAQAADVGIWMEKGKDKAQMSPGPTETLVRIGVRKNRHGQLGSRTFEFTDKWTRLEEHPEGWNGISSVEDE